MVTLGKEKEKAKEEEGGDYGWKIRSLYLSVKAKRKENIRRLDSKKMGLSK